MMIFDPIKNLLSLRQIVVYRKKQHELYEAIYEIAKTAYETDEYTKGKVLATKLAFQLRKKYPKAAGYDSLDYGKIYFDYFETIVRRHE